MFFDKFFNLGGGPGGGPGGGGGGGPGGGGPLFCCLDYLLGLGFTGWLYLKTCTEFFIGPFVLFFSYALIAF